MWIGNLMLLIINLPLVRIWVRFLDVPYRLMFPAILLFSCIGIYSVNNSTADVLMSAVLALVGYALTKLDFETAPLLLGYVLGRLMEENLRRALAISRGQLAALVQRPLSGALLAVAVVVLALAVLPAIRRKREEVFTE
jgi:putative tricarboxylic transport membrane protein